jgi:hypothetical protein
MINARSFSFQATMRDEVSSSDQLDDGRAAAGLMDTRLNSSHLAFELDEAERIQSSNGDELPPRSLPPSLFGVLGDRSTLSVQQRS